MEPFGFERSIDGISFETTIRFAEACEAFWRGRRAKILYWLMAYVVLTIVGMRLTPFAVKLWLSWGVGCVLVLVLIWAAAIVLQASHLARSSKANGSVKWTASEDGLTLEDKNATVSVKWPA